MKEYTLKDDPRTSSPSGIDYEQELNKEQYAAVKGGEGSCLVLAGAGSGKTRTLVYRVAWLLDHGVNPENILLVTFTNKASKEMLQRVALLRGHDTKGLWGGTFHHMGNKILRMYADRIGYRRNFTILDAADALEYVSASVQDIHFTGDKKTFPKSKTVYSIISYAKNAQKGIPEVVSKAWRQYEPFIPHLVRIFERYEARKQQAQVMDYDDLLVLWLELLQKHPDVLNRLATQFQYILVDEFQDTNRIQANIMYALSSVHNNIMVVGDDSQSIYSFRAADISNILKFPEVFKDTQVYKLETNYRSTPEILRLANSSIEHNTKAYEKTLEAVRDSLEVKPSVVPLMDTSKQAKFVTQRIGELTEEDKELRDIAVLFRASHQTLELEVELTKKNIPYVKRGGMRYFEQSHIKDTIAYLRIVSHSLDELSWRRVLKLYPGVGEKSASAIWEHIYNGEGAYKPVLEDLSIVKGVSSKAKKGLERLSHTLRDIEQLLNDQTEETHASELSAAINVILDGGYKDVIREKFDDADDRIEDLEQLALFSLQYPSVEQFLSDVALSEGFRGEVRGNAKEDDESDYIVLSTIHQAKGLEWPVVFVIGLLEGQFPNARALAKGEDIEEERRLFYVAVTRAMDELYLTYPLSSFFGAQLGRNFSGPSRFINELPYHSYEQWQVNQVIKSPFGDFDDEVIVDLDDL